MIAAGGNPADASVPNDFVLVTACDDNVRRASPRRRGGGVLLPSMNRALRGPGTSALVLTK
eukprot:6172904-Pleurochrysis_carterae.AAC.1